MATQHTTRVCSLEAATGKTELCPEDACPFWEPGGVVLHGRCAVEAVGVVADAELATWLLELRERLAVAGAEEDEHVMRSVFHQLLNDSAE